MRIDIRYLHNMRSNFSGTMITLLVCGRNADMSAIVDIAHISAIAHKGAGGEPLSPDSLTRSLWKVFIFYAAHGGMSPLLS